MEIDTENVTKLKFLMFENEANICWLDASIALVAHNRTFKKIVEGSAESVINKIISAYHEAIMTFNDSDSVTEQRRLKTQELLLAIQTSTQDHLKNFLKFKPGEPDSAFCALLNLIYQDKSNIKEQLGIRYIWKKQCSNCGSKSTSALKPIITFSKVITFNPECPTSIYMCTCKSEQEMKLIYKELPPCLIFHFEKGAGAGTNFHLSFSIKDREYQLTTIIILEKGSDPSLNHFVTWIRNPSHNLWLECNDLNTSFATFSPVKPEFDLKDVYISVFEAFDNLDKIINDEISDEEQDDEDVELIDLSDEDDDTKKADSSCKIRLSDNDTKNDKTSNILQDSYSEGDLSKKELLVNNMKNKSATTMQNLKMHSNKKFKESVKSKNKSVFASNLKFPIKISLNEHEVKSKAFDSQDKAVDDFIGDQKFKSESTDFLKHKIAESSTENEEENLSNLPTNNKDSTMQNLEVHDSERSKERVSNISCQNVSVNSFKSQSEIPLNKHEIEGELKNVSYQDKVVDESTEYKKSKLVIDNQISSEHKVDNASDGNNDFLSLINNNTSLMQNSEIHVCKKLKESEKSSNVSSQNTSTTNFKYPIKISLAKHEVKSKIFDHQDKAIDEFTEGEEFKAGVENKEKFSNLSTINKTSNMQNFKVCSNEKSKEKVSNVPLQNTSAGRFRPFSKIPFKKQETGVESKKIDCQDKVIDGTIENEKSKLMIDNQGIPEHKDKAASEDKKDSLSSSVNNKNRNKFKESEKTKNISTDIDEIEAKSKNFNLQNEVKQFKDETSNCPCPKNAGKRERAEDSSSERKTKITDNKYVSSSNGKKTEMLNNEASSSSLTKKTNEKNIKLSENSEEKQRVTVPEIVEKTFASFLQRLMEMRENKLKNKTSDSAT